MIPSAVRGGTTLGVVLSVLIPAVVRAQQGGDVAGTVVTANGRRPVDGASVSLLGGTLRSLTDISGRFKLGGVAPGGQRVVVRAIGLVPDTVAVDVVAGRPVEVEVVLAASPVTLNELSVTAEKRSESIQKVPIAITAYDGEFLKANNIQQFDELSNFTPGLNIQLQSPNNPGFVIRGITSDDGSSQAQTRVSVFQDGVSISKSRGSVVELFDMERIEVLKGPQGTLFGRGAQIGAVSLIQNKPTDENDAKLTVGGGNYSEKYLSGFGNARLVPDQLFGRFAFLYNSRDGFIQNAAGGTLNGKRTAAFRGSLRWLPSKSGTVDLILNYQRDTPPGTSFKSKRYAPPGGDTTAFGIAGLNGGDSLGIRRSVYGATLLWNEQLSPALSFTSTTAFRRFDSDETFDADGTLAPVLQFHEVAKGNQASQEFRFNYNDGGPATAFAGANVFYENGSQYVPFTTDERSLFALLSPFLARFGVPFIPLVKPDGTANQPVTVNPLNGKTFDTNHFEAYTNQSRTIATEAFADVTWKPVSRLSLTGGVRGTRENMHNSYVVDNGPRQGTLGAILGAGTNDLFAPTNGTKYGYGTFLSAVYRAIASVDLGAGFTAFASISSGRRPNVINVTATSTTTLNAETVVSEEAGIKGQFLRGRIQFDANAYHYRYSNFQTTIARITSTGLQTTPLDAGRAGAYGFESSVRAAIARPLTMFATYGYVDAKFDSLDSQGNAQQLAGNQFRLTAKHSFSAGFTVASQDSHAGSFYVSPNVSYRSKVFFEETNLPAISQNGYALVGLRAGYFLPRKRTELAFIVRNLLNEKYIIDAGNTGGAFGIPTFIAGPPRFISVQISQSF